MSDVKFDKVAFLWSKIEAHLKTHGYVINADMRELCGVSAAMTNSILVFFFSEGKLINFV